MKYCLHSEKSQRVWRFLRGLSPLAPGWLRGCLIPSAPWTLQLPDIFSSLHQAFLSSCPSALPTISKPLLHISRAFVRLFQLGGISKIVKHVKTEWVPLIKQYITIQWNLLKFILYDLFFIISVLFLALGDEVEIELFDLRDKSWSTSISTQRYDSGLQKIKSQAFSDERDRLVVLLSSFIYHFFSDLLA